MNEHMLVDLITHQLHTNGFTVDHITHEHE